MVNYILWVEQTEIPSVWKNWWHFTYFFDYFPLSFFTLLVFCGAACLNEWFVGMQCIWCAAHSWLCCIFSCWKKSFDILVWWYEKCNYVQFQYFVRNIEKEVLVHQNKGFFLEETSNHIPWERLLWHSLFLRDFMTCLWLYNCLLLRKP